MMLDVLVMALLLISLIYGMMSTLVTLKTLGGFSHVTLPTLTGSNTGKFGRLRCPALISALTVAFVAVAVAMRSEFGLSWLGCASTSHSVDCGSLGVYKKVTYFDNIYNFE